MHFCCTKKSFWCISIMKRFLIYFYSIQNFVFRIHIVRSFLLYFFHKTTPNIFLWYKKNYFHCFTIPTKKSSVMLYMFLRVKCHYICDDEHMIQWNGKTKDVIKCCANINNTKKTFICKVFIMETRIISLSM